MVSFTSEYRARDCGRDIRLGKRTLIYNELPRIAWERDEFPIDQTEVRTGRFSEFELFGIVVRRCQRCRVFSGFYEPDSGFEPTGAVTLRLRQFFFLPLLLLDQSAFCSTVFFKRHGLVEIRVHEPLKPLVNGFDSFANGIDGHAGGVRIRRPFLLKLVDQPIGQFCGERQPLDVTVKLGGKGILPNILL